MPPRVYRHNGQSGRQRNIWWMPWFVDFGACTCHISACALRLVSSITQSSSMLMLQLPIAKTESSAVRVTPAQAAHVSPASAVVAHGQAIGIRHAMVPLSYLHLRQPSTHTHGKHVHSLLVSARVHGRVRRCRDCCDLLLWTTLWKNCSAPRITRSGQRPPRAYTAA